MKANLNTLERYKPIKNQYIVLTKNNILDVYKEQYIGCLIHKIQRFYNEIRFRKEG